MTTNEGFLYIASAKSNCESNNSIQYCKADGMPRAARLAAFAKKFLILFLQFLEELPL